MAETKAQKSEAKKPDGPTPAQKALEAYLAKAAEAAGNK